MASNSWCEGAAQETLLLLNCWNQYLFSVSLTMDNFDALTAVAAGQEKPNSPEGAIKTYKKDGVTRV
jgi:hypothetical protein